MFKYSYVNLVNMKFKSKNHTLINLLMLIDKKNEEERLKSNLIY